MCIYIREKKSVNFFVSYSPTTNPFAGLLIQLLGFSGTSSINYMDGR